MVSQHWNLVGGDRQTWWTSMVHRFMTLISPFCIDCSCKVCFGKYVSVKWINFRGMTSIDKCHHTCSLLLCAIHQACNTVLDDSLTRMMCLPSIAFPTVISFHCNKIAYIQWLQPMRTVWCRLTITMPLYLLNSMASRHTCEAWLSSISRNGLSLVGCVTWLNAADV